MITYSVLLWSHDKPTPPNPHQHQYPPKLKRGAEGQGFTRSPKPHTLANINLSSGGLQLTHSSSSPHSTLKFTSKVISPSSKSPKEPYRTLSAHSDRIKNPFYTGAVHESHLNMSLIPVQPHLIQSASRHCISLVTSQSDTPTYLTVSCHGHYQDPRSFGL